MERVGSSESRACGKRKRLLAEAQERVKTRHRQRRRRHHVHNEYAYDDDDEGACARTVPSLAHDDEDSQHRATQATGDDKRQQPTQRKRRHGHRQKRRRLADAKVGGAASSERDGPAAIGPPPPHTTGPLAALGNDCFARVVAMLDEEADALALRRLNRATREWMDTYVFDPMPRIVAARLRPLWAADQCFGHRRGTSTAPCAAIAAACARHGNGMAARMHVRVARARRGSGSRERAAAAAAADGQRRVVLVGMMAVGGHHKACVKVCGTTVVRRGGTVHRVFNRRCLWRARRISIRHSRAVILERLRWMGGIVPHRDRVDPSRVSVASPPDPRAQVRWLHAARHYARRRVVRRLTICPTATVERTYRMLASQVWTPRRSFASFKINTSRVLGLADLAHPMADAVWPDGSVANGSKPSR